MKAFNPDKELKKIQHRNKNKVILFIISLLVVGVIGYSFALYQVRYSKRIIYTKVAPFSNKDINIMAIYIDNNSSEEFPKKNTGYKFDHIDCDNDSAATFDTINWKINLKAGGKDKCNVYFVKEKEGIPNAPDLYQGLIPVVYTSDGTVLVADGTKDWYNYDEKRWANAVLVDKSNYGKYVIDGEYQSNAEIPMSEILQMYVWIPRYKYQLFNAVNGEGKPEQEIQIEFESGTLSTGEVSCTISDKGVETCKNAENGKWYTHPAFKFGNTNLTGIWVGKFESSGSNTSVKIIPNVTPMLNISVSYMFNASRDIELTYSSNFNLDSTQIDTHMMKNMEWGAMAYLTQSKYGRCDGQGTCTEVTINSQTYRTGYNNASNLWNTLNGVKASTTENMYGVYDVSGDAYDCVMGNMVNVEGNFDDNGAGFTTIPDSRYYDKYEYGTNNADHKRGHLGDSTREIVKIFGNLESGWYGDHIGISMAARSWFIRGDIPAGQAHAGVFASHSKAGGGDVYSSFRVVITAQDGS